MTEKSPRRKRPLQEVTRLDWSLLDGDIREVSAGRSLSAKFGVYSIKIILGLNENDAREAITDASQDRGIDAVVIDYATQQIHLFQFKYYESDDHVRKQFPSRSVDFAISFIMDLLERRNTLLETTNQILRNKVLEIWDAIEKTPFQVNFHFASNGRKLEPSHRSRLAKALEKFDVKIHEHGASDILNGSHPRSADRPRRKLEFQPGRAEFQLEGKRMIVGIVNLIDIAEFIENSEARGSVDASMFADNVRGALGTKNDVNKAMLRMMAVPSGADFVFRNNGITIVADQILYQAGCNFPVEMVGPQIVNGGQTAASAFATYKRNPSFLKRNAGQAVLVKAIESRDPQFKEDVALSTNSQTRIYGRDLRAIDETQQKIERLLRRLGFCYLRKRTDTSDLPRCQTIDMARLGQLILAYYKHQPELAKTRSNEIFGDMYEDVFDAEFLGAERIICVHTLNYMLDERRQIAKDRLRAAGKSQYEEEWILEGVFHVLFVISLLCERDKLDTYDLRSATARLSEAIEIVGRFVQDHKTVAAYRLFRTVGTADALQKAVVGTPRRRKDISQFELF